jgi:hypothetical protein
VIVCPNCGARNPDGTKLCLRCQEILEWCGTPRGVPRSMSRCASCGASVDSRASRCPSCGGPTQRSRYEPPREELGETSRIVAYLLSFFVPFLGFFIGGLLLLAGGEDNKRTGGACMVMATLPTLLSLSALSLLISPSGIFGNQPQGEPQPPADKMYVSTGWNDVLCTFSSQSLDMSWDYIQVTLSDGRNSTSWQPLSADLLGPGPVTMQIPPATLGDLVVWCNVTDMGGDGILGSGDSVYLSTSLDHTFSSGVEYTISILLPSQGRVLYQCAFFGGHFGIVL